MKVLFWNYTFLELQCGDSMFYCIVEVIYFCFKADFNLQHLFSNALWVDESDHINIW